MQELRPLNWCTERRSRWDIGDDADQSEVGDAPYGVSLLSNASELRTSRSHHDGRVEWLRSEKHPRQFRHIRIER